MTIADKRLASLSIFCIILIFALQVLLIYNLYKSRLGVLQGQVNTIIFKSYSKDIGLRLSHANENLGNNLSMRDLELDRNSSNFYKDTVMPMALTDGYFSIATIRAEQNIASKYPVDIKKLDSIVLINLKKYNINVNFSVLLLDSSNNTIDSSNESIVLDNVLLISDDIPLDFQHSKLIRLVAYPESEFYIYISGIALLSFVLSLVCFYCFYSQLRNMLRQKTLSRLKNDFFSDVSHELKQPLSVLRQALDSFQNQTIMSSPQRRDHLLNVVDSEISKIDNKLKMIMSLTMQEEGIFELSKTDFDISKMVYNLSDEILMFPTKEIDIDIEDDLKLNPIVYADKTHIEQVISNLLRNAIKYSENNLDLKVKLYRDLNNTVYISVKDNGIGISNADQKIIFEKYSRVDTNSVAEGNGIGLNYIKRVIGKHGGQVKLISKLGVGSEFIISLPQSKKY